MSYGIDSTHAGFFVHFEKSPTNDNLFIAGTDQLWRCDDFFNGVTPTWVANSPIFYTTNGSPVSITAMAFAPRDTTGMIYAFGTEDGQLLLTTNGGVNWQSASSPSTLPARFISGIAFNPLTPGTLYVTYSGFNASTPGHSGHCFVSSNAFSLSPTWTDISPPVDLPNNCLAIDPNYPNNIYVGTDTGVWYSGNAGTSWTHQGPSMGMPNVAVFDLRMDSAGQPTAFTHGRGAFKFKTTTPVINIWYQLANPTIPVGCLTCPPEIYVNPGDLVELPVLLQNTLPIDTVNLIATIVPSAYYTAVSGPQSYGVLQGLGSKGSRTFAFRLNTGTVGGPGSGSSSSALAYNCGDAGQLTLQLSDQGIDLGQVSVPFKVGVANFPLAQDFTSVPAGTPLPPGWTSSSTGIALPWVAGTNVPPNEVPGDVPDSPDDQPAPGPTEYTVFTPSVPGRTHSYLVSPVFTPQTASAMLFFRQAYLVSNKWDGCALEISTSATSGFQDIITAGGAFVQDGYNVLLNNHNPLGVRPAWSGNSGGWLPVRVQLPPSTMGQPVQLRWHLAGSAGVPGGGYYLDAVSVTEAQCLPPVSNPVIVNPRILRNNFYFDIDTVSSRSYFVEYKTNLNDTTWTALTTLLGDGTRQTVSGTVPGASQTFYHFRVQ